MAMSPRSPAERLRRWHPRFTTCAVCTRPAAGFGFFAPRSKTRPRERRWFCSMICQAHFARKARKGMTMADLTEEERMAILGSLKAVARQMESCGWQTRLCDLTESQVLWLIETAVQEFREGMAEFAARQNAEIPF